jgi:hypothetical protein
MKEKPKAPGKDRATEPTSGYAKPFEAGRNRALMLPRNCFIVPMIILDPPEPIKQNRKAKR